MAARATKTKPTAVLAVTEISGSEWEVKSSSGNTYTVTYCGCGDEPDMVSLWECDCPSAKYHPNRLCKHINAVINHIDNQEESDEEW